MTGALDALIIAFACTPSLNLLHKSSSCLEVSSMTAQPGVCQTWSETPNMGFLMSRLNKCAIINGKYGRKQRNVINYNLTIIMVTSSDDIRYAFM